MRPEDIEKIMAKEVALVRIVAWLKGKGLWEECNRDLELVASVVVEGDKAALPGKEG